jgi:AcrR family transcriptional regulator
MSKKEELIAAARELLAENGYQATSPRDIQERAGAGQGSFYHHFRSKQQLAAIALAETAAEMTAALDDIFVPQKEPMGRIWDYLTQARDPLRGCRLGRIAQESAIAEEPLRAPIAGYFADVEGRIVAALSEAESAGTVSLHLQPEDIAATLVAVVQGGYIVARAGANPALMDAAVRGAVEMLEVATRRGS